MLLLMYIQVFAFMYEQDTDGTSTPISLSSVHSFAVVVPQNGQLKSLNPAVGRFWTDFSYRDPK